MLRSANMLTARHARKLLDLGRASLIGMRRHDSNDYMVIVRHDLKGSINYYKGEFEDYERFTERVV